MRIVAIQHQAEEIGQKETQALKAADNFLRGKIPEIVPILNNPAAKAFLMKFIDLVASDPSILAGFKNALQTVYSAGQSDASSTGTSGAAGAAAGAGISM